MLLNSRIAVGAGVIGAGYLVTQYVLSKINDARERMSSERIAKENLRRRFEQNQEDCMLTVLALLPTATQNILEAMSTESITYEIQQMKGGTSAARSVKSSGGESAATGATGPAPSVCDTIMTEDDRSMVSMQSESGVHASQVALPSPSAAGEGVQEGGQAAAQKRKTKRRLWDDLTISSITRAFTLLYTLALLTMLTRVQLNLLGRRTYLSSVISLATGSAQATISLENNDDDCAELQLGDDFDVNRKYLTFSWWLLNRGWHTIQQRVEAAVREVFGPLSPRDQLSFEALTEKTRQVRRLVEQGAVIQPSQSVGPSTNWLSCLLPPPEMEDSVLRDSGILGDSASSPPTTFSSSPSSSASLRRLLDETSDLVESPTFAAVLSSLLDAGFSTLLDTHVAPEVYALPAPPSAGTTPAELARLRGSHTVLLPKVLSVLTRQAHAIGAGGVANEYLREMEAVRDLEAFAAVVYSSNWENEILAEEGVTAGVEGKRKGAAPVPTVKENSTPVEESQMSGTTESVVVVDPPQSESFESAWERAVEPKA